MLYQREIDQLLAELVAIDSRNPMLDPKGAGETRIAAFIGEKLRSWGVEVYTIDPPGQPGRPSVIGILRGTGGGKNLALNAHIDTVGFGAMIDPTAPRLENGRMYGRGAYDMKCGLAASMMTAYALSQGERPRGDLILMAVADEEYASVGTQTLLTFMRDMQTDGAIVTEPTELQLCIAHKGFAWATITTHGRAAHGSRRDEGIDAIAHMGRVLVALENRDAALQKSAPHPLLGHASLHASLIEGGNGLSTYPPACKLQIERRTLPHENEQTVKDELADILNRLSAQDSQFNAQAEVNLYRPPLETSTDHPLVAAIRKNAVACIGQEPPIIGVPFWMDAALIAAEGIPTAVFGPSGAGAHADVEWVDMQSVYHCTEVLIETTRQFCNG